MSTENSYAKPPLIEALLDIQVGLPADFSPDKLLKCQHRVKTDYPTQEALQFHSGAIKFGSGKEVTTSASSRPIGYRFLSFDRKQLFQAKTDGFTFNRLAPYTGWATFFVEAKRMWDEYRRITKPTRYKRVSLRYINRFDFPAPRIHLQKYFRTAPEVASELPQTVNGYFFEVNLPLEEIQSVVSIRQTMIEPQKPEQVSVLLDIDVFRTDELLGENDMWPLFETLRVWKNKVFEACITNDTRELIR